MDGELGQNGPRELFLGPQTHQTPGLCNQPPQPWAVAFSGRGSHHICFRGNGLQGSLTPEPGLSSGGGHVCQVLLLHRMAWL